MGCFDLQVNGFAGVDFNQDGLSPEALRRACEALRRDGVQQILATIITDRPERMEARLARIVEWRKADPVVGGVIAGFHIEGPFLSPLDGYRGAHPPDAIRRADVGLMRALLAAADGLARVVTLAPEQDEAGEVIRFLAGQGVTVSAGHTDASFSQLQAAVGHGLSLFTHLGNGCPAHLPRHDNIIQRALALRESLWFGLIADGVHIPFFALRNYLRLAGIERCFVVTDAMAAAGLGPGRYRLGRWEVEVGEELAAREPGGAHLLGSALCMSRAAQNLRGELGLSAAAVDDLTWTNPRRALGLPVS